MPRLVYSRRYDIRAFGLELLHPFDSRKYSRAWKLLQKQFGRRLAECRVRPPRQVSQNELLHVHTASYLNQLADSKYVARAIEVSVARFVPATLLDRCVLAPMRWATMGSIVATEEALRTGLAVNLSGGYHHAKPSAGEGFCLYSDIGLALENTRRLGMLSAVDRVLYMDLDVHQGNGVCHVFLEDPRVFIFDMFNAQIYPAHDTEPAGGSTPPFRC